MDMRSFNPTDLHIKDLHQYIVGAIAPRPIAFVSTLDEDGRPNLAPYSFFNAFSSNPPILVFSTMKKGPPGISSKSGLYPEGPLQLVHQPENYDSKSFLKML